MTGSTRVTLGTALIAVALAADAMAAPARGAVKKKTTASTKLNANQIYAKFDSIEEQLRKMNLLISAGPKAAAPVAAPAGDGMAAREMTQAFYNYGVYSRQAAGSRVASRAIKLVTLVVGGSLVVHGWTDSFDKSAPRTINNAFHDYPAFSYGLSTVLIGQLIGVIMDMRADGADARAARALMKPLEVQSSPAAAAPASPAPSMIAPASAAP